jgi:GT2 family glycosyltransferase
MRCPTLNDLPAPPIGRTGWPWTEGAPSLCKLEGNSDVSINPIKWPKITIVTPSYNQCQFLEETIRSVLLQAYPNLEYIVVDGGSTDNSAKIIHKYEKHLTWWVSERDKGQSHAINKGFERGTGEIYAFLNSDDIYEPGALYNCALSLSGKYKWVVGQVRYFQEDIGYWPVPQARGHSLAEWFVPCPFSQPGCFWRAELHHETGKFREDLHYFFDYEFWLRIRFLKQIKPLIIDQPVAIYRVHPQSKTVRDNSAFALEAGAIVDQYKSLLSPWQKSRLSVGLRHRKARMQGARAVSLLKKGKVWAACSHLISALIVWPLLVVDLYGFLLAIRALSCAKDAGPGGPDVWKKGDHQRDSADCDW